MTARIVETIDREANAWQYRQLVRAVLKGGLPGHATALVVDSDYLAHLVVPVLAENEIRIPGDLSLLSFDDNHDGVINKYSSYNFRVSGVVAAMISHILDPTLLKDGVSINNPFELEGAVVDRGTVAHR